MKLYSRRFPTSTCSFKINMEHWAESCFVKDNSMREVNLSSILFQGGVWIDNQHNSSTWLVTQPVLWYLGHLHPGNTTSEFRRQIPNKGKEIGENSTHFLFYSQFFSNVKLTFIFYCNISFKGEWDTSMWRISYRNKQLKLLYTNISCLYEIK